ncbi:hypothetical protein P376_3823 [Streptomyces sp. HCCB10043]|nr:hypothetical protein P376_3823 [Streptomyces sp. HCCB10043]
MQRGVEDGGVQTVVLGRGPGVLREADLRTDLVATAPGGAQPLEHRAVPGAACGQLLVHPVGVQGLGALGRPHGQRGGCHGARTFERAARVLDPGGAVAAFLGPRVHAEGVRPGGVGRSCQHLDAYGAVLGQDERGVEHQVAQGRGADPPARVDRQLDEGGAGQQDRPAHGVVAQPGVRGEGEPAREQQPLGVGEYGGGAEQRVVRLFQAEAGRVPAGGGGLQPVPLPLEGVRRQLHGAGPALLEPLLPVRRGAAYVQLGQCGGAGQLLGSALAQQRHHEEAAVRGAGQALLRHRGEHTAGAEFDEAGDALGAQALDGVAEPHRLTHVPHPVVGGAQVVARGEFTGDGGDDGDARLLEVQSGRDLAELLQDGFHERRVRRVAHPDPLGADPLGREQFRHGVRLAGLARDDHGVGAVDGRDADAVGQQRTYLVLGRVDSDHRPALGQPLHQPAARGDEAGRVGQGQDAGDMGGRQLAGRVPGEEVGAQPHGFGEPEERDLDGEQRGLGVAHLVECLGVPVDHRAQRPVQVLVQLGADLVVRGGEGGVDGGQFTAHAEALRTAAGEEERGGGLAPGQSGLDVGGVLAVGDGAQPAHQLVAVRSRDDGPVVEWRAGGGECAGHVQRAVLGAVAQVLHEAGGLRPQRVAAAARQHPGQGPHRRGLALRRTGGVLREGGARGRLFEDHVRVGAAQAEGGDARAARAAVGLPVDGFGQQLDRALGPVDVAAGPVDVQGLRQQLVAHRQDHLHHPGHPGGALRVPQVRLHRAEPLRPVLRAVLAVRRDQRVGLDGVADLGGGAVGLDHVDLVRGEAGVLQRLPDDALLGGAVGRGDAVGGAVLVDGAAPDDGENGVAVAAGVGEPFEQQHARTLGPGRAVGGLREGPAAAVARQVPVDAELDEGAR